MIRISKLSMLVIFSLFVIFTAACSSPISTVNKENLSSTSIESNTKNEVVGFGAKGAKEDKTLTLENMLTYAIQDEYLAHAEYDYILKKLFL